MRCQMGFPPNNSVIMQPKAYISLPGPHVSPFSCSGGSKAGVPTCMVVLPAPCSSVNFFSLVQNLLNTHDSFRSQSVMIISKLVIIKDFKYTCTSMLNSYQDIFRLEIHMYNRWIQAVRTD